MSAGIEDYLEERLGQGLPANDDIRYNCPFCDDGRDRHKLYVEFEKNIWHCFNCGRHGYIYSLIAEIEGMTYKDARELSESLGLSSLPKGIQDSGLTLEDQLLLAVQTTVEPEPIKEVASLKPAPFVHGYKSLTDNYMLKEAQPFIRYCVKRGFTAEQIDLHQIGYVVIGTVDMPDGTVRPISNSLVFITYDFNGNYIYWNTRSIEPNPKVKSLNAPQFDNCYSKGTCIFNLNTAIHKSEIVITEGVPDALALGDSGIGTFGKQVTTDQVNLILNNINDEQKLYIMLDMDAKTNIRKLAIALYAHHKNTFIVINKTNQDANDLGKETAWNIIHTESVPANDYGIMRLELG